MFAAAPIWHSGEEECSLATRIETPEFKKNHEFRNIPHCIRKSVRSSVPRTSDDGYDCEVGNGNDLVYLALDMGRGLGVDNKWRNQIDAHLIVACEPLWRAHCADGTLLLELEFGQSLSTAASAVLSRPSECFRGPPPMSLLLVVSFSLLLRLLGIVGCTLIVVLYELEVAPGMELWQDPLGLV
ncbi:hypothetical protein GCK72_026276 [Caenorhabditis remanei]|uniref:Uncharacterized protein n=1 Tax=Caenorhabditis remanei TaxID=31234 RepID=A0A6A5G4D0_CAERE|nr:hypothetical protein GCK72_026276 [Caenorhabditis remanei]KAF1749807.1 hypothetical protein GCK72_026276 [Caenorhabditis remanei]